MINDSSNCLPGIISAFRKFDSVQLPVTLLPVQSGNSAWKKRDFSNTFKTELGSREKYQHAAIE